MRIILLVILIISGKLICANPLEKADMWSEGDSGITNMGPAVTNISIMVGHMVGDIHYVFSRNTRPGRLVGYDAGLLIRTIYLGSKDPGKHELIIEAGDLVSGEYLVYIAAGQEMKSIRINLLRD